MSQDVPNVETVTDTQNNEQIAIASTEGITSLQPSEESRRVFAVASGIGLALILITIAIGISRVL